MRRTYPLVPAVIGVFAAARGVGYVADWGVGRHHAETAWIWFGVAALVAAAMAVWAGPDAHGASAARIHPLVLFGLLALALLIYRPAVPLGLLSDDFVLLRFADRGDLMPAEWRFVRILPLLLWRAALRLVGDAYVAGALHVSSLVFHGVNGYLVARVAQCLGVASLSAAGAGILFVAYPTSVEATAWLAAMPDLMVTTLILLALLAALTIDNDRRAIAVSLVCTIAALITKENAVVAGPLLLVTAPLTVASRRRRLMLIGAVTLAITAGYIGWRVSAGLLTDVVRPLHRLAIKNYLTTPFATLGLPVHRAAMYQTPLVWPIWTSALGLLLASAAFRWRRDSWLARRSLWSVLWILIAISPAMGVFAANHDLQGTRYLYLSTVAWSIALAIHLPRSIESRMTGSTIVIIAITATVLASVTRSHLAFWQQASARRDAVLRAAATLPADCDIAYIPHSEDVRGAYVFRNGLPEALARSGRMPVSLAARPEDVRAECRR